MLFDIYFFLQNNFEFIAVDDRLFFNNFLKVKVSVRKSCNKEHNIKCDENRTEQCSAHKDNRYIINLSLVKSENAHQICISATIVIHLFDPKRRESQHLNRVYDHNDHTQSQDHLDRK